MACSFASSSALLVLSTFDIVDGVAREDLVSSTFEIDALNVVDDVACGDLVEAASADGPATFDVDAEGATPPFEMSVHRRRHNALMSTCPYRIDHPMDHPMDHPFPNPNFIPSISDIVSTAISNVRNQIR